MDQNDAFRKFPWTDEPPADWNLPSYWDQYYLDLLAGTNVYRLGKVIHRRIDLLIRMLTKLGELPRRSTPCTFLDAGCGMALIPRVLSYWGFQVTAIDCSAKAIEAARERPRDDDELAKGIAILESGTYIRGWTQADGYSARSLELLHGFQATGGSVSYIVGDWCTADLQPAAFDLIYCRNGLRYAPKPYWRRSLLRFHELLVPGGTLLVENVNAIGIQDDVEELIAECGFLEVSRDGKREGAGKFVMCMWPTG